MRGRSGRQGAVGESYIFESVDDDFFRYLITGRVKDMLLNSGDEYGLFQSSFLKRAIENAREKMHHKKFKGMSDARIISERVESTKEEFFRLMEKERFYREELSALILAWAKNDTILTAAEEDLEEDSPKSLDHASVFLKPYHPDILSAERDESLTVMLYEAAFAHIDKFSFDGSDPSLAEAIKRALMTHLSQMAELEDIYSRSDTVYSDKFFREQYLKNRKDCFAKAVDEWLIATAVTVYGTKNE